MPFDGWDLVLAALATFKLVLMLTVEDGPWDLTLRLRTCLGCYDYDPDQRYPDGTMMPDSARGRWWGCPICVALFPVAPVVVLLMVLRLWPVTLWLGLAGMSALLFRWRTWK
jgi:hypothetical protein